MTDLTVHLTQDDVVRGLRSDVRTGLRATPKTLPPKWFYDARGSDLFERITRLPEYYPTRCEREILATRSAEIVALTGAAEVVLVVERLARASGGGTTVGTGGVGRARGPTLKKSPITRVLRKPE